MQTLFNRIAWFRMEHYLLRHKSSRIVVMGTYGRTLAANMAYNAMRQHRHVRLGYAVQDISDIPLGVLGRDHETNHQNIITFLTGVWQRELHEQEPDTIVVELPLLQPGFIPYATSRILPNVVAMHHIANFEEEYRDAIKYLARDVVIVANADDQAVMNVVREADLKIITYGRSKDADIRIARTVRGDAQMGIFITMHAHGVDHELFLPNLFAKEHVSAFACAIACAYAIKIPIPEAMRGIQHMTLPQGALRKREGERGEVIISEYVECVDQMLESLKSFQALPHVGRKVAILQDISSIGAQDYERIGKQAMQSAQLILCIGSGMRGVQDVIRKSGDKVDAHWFSTYDEAMTWLYPHITSSDLILDI